MDIFRTPLLTSRETATHLQMPVSTLNYWLAEDHDGPALVHGVDPQFRGWPRLPFVGVVEAYVLRALRDLGLTKAAIRQAAWGEPVLEVCPASPTDTELRGS